jgi:STE24 endopeptidase
MTDFLSIPSAPLLTTLIFSLALLLSVVLKFWLVSRQVRHVALHRHAVPDSFLEKISLAAHQKAAEYTIAKLRFSLLELGWGTGITLCWTLLGGLSLLNHVLIGIIDNGLMQQVALVATKQHGPCGGQIV